MRNVRKTPDHGAALRVPPANDAEGWMVLLGWLGDAGQLVGRGEVEVATAVGAHVAGPGDWIVLSATGAYHVARPRQH